MRSVLSHARACLDSAETLEHELDLAREVQESLFPAEIPALPGIRVAALNQPARIVSGDSTTSSRWTTIAWWSSAPMSAGRDSPQRCSPRKCSRIPRDGAGRLRHPLSAGIRVRVG